MSIQPFNSDSGFSTTGNITAGNLVLIDTTTITANVELNLVANSDSNISGLLVNGDSNANLYAHTNVLIYTDSNGPGNTWTFDNTGVATLPGEGILQSIDDTVTLRSFNTSTGNANSVYLGTSGGLGFNDSEIGGNWLEIFRNGAEPEIRVPVGLGNLNIQTASGNTPYYWTFDDTGNLTLPSSLIVPANSIITGVGASPAPSINGFNNIDAIAFSASGNVTAGNISTGKITLTNGAVIKDTAGEAVAFGQGAGNTTQGEQAVAIGLQAGFTSQGNFAVAIGKFSANSSQGEYAVSVGPNAGQENQLANAVAIGSSAGASSQGINSVAVGVSAAYNAQGNNAVAIGNSAAYLVQGNNSVAVGVNAGIFYLGINSIAIGANAGNNLQGNNSIIFNATGSNLRNTTANTFTVAPIRNDVANTANVMFYNAVTNEVTYGNTISMAGNITGGNLLFGSGVVSGTGNITGGNLAISGNSATITSANYSIGYLNIPQVSFAANATIGLTDAGKHYYSTSASNLLLTIANNTSVSWTVGTAITIVNRGTANITIAQGTGVSLYLAGNSTSGNRTMTTYGMSTLMNVAANVWMINGTGVV